jgi:hypothetical protein
MNLSWPRFIIGCVERGFLCLPTILETDSMSHIVQIQTEIRDPIAIVAACDRLKLPAPSHRTVQLFSAQATGLAVELPGWRYPVVCQTDTGQLQYDNYGGNWGEQRQLDLLLQLYTVEKAKLEARKRGYSVTEQQLENGSIKVRIQAGN